MDHLDKTTRVAATPITPQAGGGLTVTIFDGDSQPHSLRFNAFKKKIISFGRSSTNDIVLVSPLVSREHGRFCLKNNTWVIEDKALFGDRPSENGLIYNNSSILSRPIHDGDFIRIDDGNRKADQRRWHVQVFKSAAHGIFAADSRHAKIFLRDKCT